MSNDGKVTNLNTRTGPLGGQLCCYNIVCDTNSQVL